jgi:hypothetical protein
MCGRFDRRRIIPPPIFYGWIFACGGLQLCYRYHQLLWSALFQLKAGMTERG